MKKSRKVGSYKEVTRLILVETGMTAYRLAKASGLPLATVYELVRGDREPRADALHRILIAAGKPWAWLDEVYERPTDGPTADSGKP